MAYLRKVTLTDGVPATAADDGDVLTLVGMTPITIDVTLSLDTNIYASGDLLADAQIIAACTPGDDIATTLETITVIDQDDQKAAFDIYITNLAASWGSENSAPSISDANALGIIGRKIPIAVSDYTDLGGVSVAGVDGIGKVCIPVTGSDDLYIAVVNGAGTPTYTASGIKIRLGFRP